MICFIPMQIVTAVTWGTNQPRFAAKQRQPLKGLLLTAVFLVMGVIVAVAYLAIVGGNVTPSTPMLLHAIIVSVIVTFWGAIMFGGWFFKVLFKNDALAG